MAYLLQAHRGVSTEAPENTMSAFRLAAAQKYPIIEADPAVTRDGKVVLLHDATVNRTGRNPDGSAVAEERRVRDLTYEELLRYDFGIGFSKKYAGEKIPLLSELLSLAKESGTQIKIDSKIWSFTPEEREAVMETVRRAQAPAAFTCPDISSVREIASKFPDASVHYDGEVNDENLKMLSETVPKDRLTVWLPYRCARTEWVRAPFADKEIADKVKKFASLGIWILSEQEELADATENLGADVVETTGKLKPVQNVGFFADTHTHSLHSHDGRERIADMARAAYEQKLSAVCITDHCDIEYRDSTDLEKNAAESFYDTASTAKEYENKLSVLSGIEIGEAIFYPDTARQIEKSHPFDVIVGSVHAARYPSYTMPYSVIDFSRMSDATVNAYLARYFEDMLETVETFDFDVLAHLTCPLRYISGKFGRKVDLSVHGEAIDAILRGIITRSIALEVNTSSLDTQYDVLLPDRTILERYRMFGGYLLTLASDAHVKDRVGHGFERAVSALKELGFDTVYYYKKRMAVPCCLF